MKIRSRIHLVLAPTRTHLTFDRSEALCGADVRGVVTTPMVPGHDFGEHPNDCKRCAWRLAGKS